MRTDSYNTASQYGQIDIYTRVGMADNCKLIEILFDGLLQKLSAGKAYMRSQEISKKGMLISKALDIIGNLRAALNKDAGGEVAKNLDSLYEYMERRLLQANLENNAEIVEEIITLVLQIKEAWHSISVTQGAVGMVKE